MNGNKFHLTDTELKLANILWNKPPLPFSDIAQLGCEQLNWNRGITYAVFRSLCNKGVFQKENRIISTVLTRDDLLFLKGIQFLDECYNGSLSAFAAAYYTKHGISEHEARLILDFLRKFSK